MFIPNAVAWYHIFYTYLIMFFSLFIFMYTFFFFYYFNTIYTCKGK